MRRGGALHDSKTTGTWITFFVRTLTINTKIVNRTPPPSGRRRLMPERPCSGRRQMQRPGEAVVGRVVVSATPQLSRSCAGRLAAALPTAAAAHSAH